MTRETHVFLCRLDRRRGDDQDASIGFCGVVIPDVPFRQLYPDRVAGIGPARVANLAAFATDEAATCRTCRAVLASRRPGWLRRLWRRLTGTGPRPDPPPDEIIE